jgi:hypothetical protein
MRCKPLICLIAATGLLTSCSPAHNTAIAMHLPYSPFTALLIADGISVINTGKTVEDHVIGWVSGQDCSVIRASHGEDYCISKAPPPTIAVVSYCYHTLAKTSCYDRKQENDASSYTGHYVTKVPVSSY